jgi:hypothetical protein
MGKSGEKNKLLRKSIIKRFLLVYSVTELSLKSDAAHREEKI